ARGALRQDADKQSGIMDARQRRHLSRLVDRIHAGGVGKEGADDRSVILDMGSEIAERIAMTAFDDGMCIGRDLHHEGASEPSLRMRNKPVSGTRSQAGRCASSYSIS